MSQETSQASGDYIQSPGSPVYSNVSNGLTGGTALQLAIVAFLAVRFLQRKPAGSGQAQSGANIVAAASISLGPNAQDCYSTRFHAASDCDWLSSTK